MVAQQCGGVGGLAGRRRRLRRAERRRLSQTGRSGNPTVDLGKERTGCEVSEGKSVSTCGGGGGSHVPFLLLKRGRPRGFARRSDRSTGFTVRAGRLFFPLCATLGGTSSRGPRPFCAFFTVFSCFESWVTTTTKKKARQRGEPLACGLGWLCHLLLLCWAYTTYDHVLPLTFFTIFFLHTNTMQFSEVRFVNMFVLHRRVLFTMSNCVG